MKFSSKQIQWTLVCGAIILFAVLLFASHNNQGDVSMGDSKSAQDTVSLKIEDIVASDEKNMPDSLGKIFQKFPKNYTDTNNLNTIINFFLERKMVVSACFYFGKKAALINTSLSWYIAGNRFYYSTQFVKERTAVIPALFSNARKCYQKVLSMDSVNMDAKIQLASTYVEGSDPMKGIGMLKSLETTDSLNLQIQLVLARFATRSGQMDKALVRYLKVIRIKPDYIEAYLLLADVYQNLGDKPKTIEVLEKYVSLCPDKEARDQVRKYIEQIKNTHV